MGRGNVVRNVGHHGNAPLNVPIKQVGSKLRIEDLARQTYQGNDEQNGDDGDEEIRDY